MDYSKFSPLYTALFERLIKDKQKSPVIIIKDVERDKCLSLFDYWQKKEDKTNY